MSEPATKEDIERALREAIADLKIYIGERESSWLKWLVGFQLSYFVVVIGVVYFAVARTR